MSLDLAIFPPNPTAEMQICLEGFIFDIFLFHTFVHLLFPTTYCALSYMPFYFVLKTIVRLKCDESCLGSNSLIRFRKEVSPPKKGIKEDQ